MPISSPPNPRRSTRQPSLGFVILSIAKNLLFACAAVTLCATATNAQSLAHPGWAGSGLTPESWWRHAVLYRIDGSQLPTLTQLPSLQAFGIDAILLTPEAMQPPATPTTTPDTNPALTDPPLTLDDLLFECSRLHIRVLIPLDAAPINATPADTLALARSWLYRGAAGFVVSNLDKLTQTPPSTTTPPTTTTPGPVHLHKSSTNQPSGIHLATPVSEPQILVNLRKLLTQFPGEHILIGAASPTPTPTLQLQIAVLTATPDTAQLSTLSAQSSPHALLSLATTSAITPIEATRLLATTEPIILDSTAVAPDVLARVFPPLEKPVEPDAPKPTPPPPPASNVYGTFTPYVQKDTTAERKRKAAEAKAQQDAANIAADTFPVQPMYQPISETPEGYVAFYHRLIQLHRANATLHDGTLRALDIPAPAFAWTASRTSAAPLIVICNPSDAPLKLDLSKGLQKFGNEHDMVRTLLHTAAASGVVNIDKVAVPPHGVYIGELAHGYTYR